MKFVVDHQLPPDLVDWLRVKGHQADHVFPLGLGAADDREIWEWCASASATVITKDSDFARRRQASANGPTIVWLRIGNAATLDLLVWLDARWVLIEAELNANRRLIEVR